MSAELDAERCVGAALALRRLYWTNGFRPLAVWSPDAAGVDNPGKRPQGDDWRQRAAQDPPEAAIKRPDPRALNTGILCGDVVGFDIDILKQDLVDQIARMIKARCGNTPLERIGLAPKTLLVYRCEEPFRKLQTSPQLIWPDGSPAGKVEVLAQGQMFVADGIHPDTRQPYRWLDGCPATVPRSELPAVTEEMARAIIAEAERLLRLAGATDKARNKPAPKGQRQQGDGGFFRKVNDAALGAVAAWAPRLFPRAKFEPGTGAWRVSSMDLGRNLEEDISIHPEGIRDWGEEIRLTPVDLVMRYGGLATPIEAALWLCDCLGIEPGVLGYTGKRTVPMPNGVDDEGPGPPAARPAEPPAKPSIGCAVPEQSAFVREEARAATENAAESTRSRPNGHDASGSTFCFTVREWLDRDLPSPDFLMGEVFSTTSRGLLVADTGLGKTNFCMALAFEMALGRNFLHWRAGRACRVLYIDGEMSRRLLKSRLTDAARRAGAVPESLFAISRDDLPDMPPLNTEDGQRYIDKLIEAVGGVDFIFFDNVQALLPGDMKDEEPWQQTLPWIRELTHRSIGQLWIHHTGHDKTRSYGTKTREWQLDIVILLEAVERAGADIAFALKFTKARERGPHNRADFNEVTVTLSLDRWKAEGAARRRGKPSPAGRKFFDALMDALAHAGTVHQQSAGQVAVTTRQWLDECVRGGLLDGSAEVRIQATNRAQISKYRRELVSAEWIACNGDSVWRIGHHN